MRRAAVAVVLVTVLGACSDDRDAAPRPAEPPPRTTSTAPATGPARPAATFQATVRRIDPALRARMRTSHRPGCPTPLTALRHVTVSYVGFDGRPRTGELVLHDDHARPVVSVFRALFEAGWPIRRMRLVDEYAGIDDRSLAANNTSAYNCRQVAGADHWSRHAFGAAVDINPVQNPYLRPDGIAPPNGRRYADLPRTTGSRVPRGVITEGDLVVEAFTRIGWEWGGRFSDPDYQHFFAPE